MAPRLAHKKTRTGCQRCKARKVKVSRSLTSLPASQRTRALMPDSATRSNPSGMSSELVDEDAYRLPLFAAEMLMLTFSSGACTRHAVPCEYTTSPHATHNGSPLSGAADGSAATDHLLELRLMYEWGAYTCMSLSTTWEFWKFQVPMIAFRFRYVLDALLAVTALHASRQKPRYWSTVEGRMRTVDESETASPAAAPPGAAAASPAWLQTSKTGKTSGKPPDNNLLCQDPPGTRWDMLEISRRYFASALEGHQRAVANLSLENYQPAYLCSLLVCYYSLFTLSEGSGEEDSLMLDPMKWFRLSQGTRLIIDLWSAEIGIAECFVAAGGMYGEPDLSDVGELFKAEHRVPFLYLLAPVQEDVIGEDDREAYEHTLSYIGLIYKGIVGNLEPPLASGRRVIAMPARVPQRFTDLVEANEPRALAMLAHTFAAMKLAEKRLPWFKGIADRQIPRVCFAMPKSWNEAVRWPMRVLQTKDEELPS